MPLTKLLTVVTLIIACIFITSPLYGGGYEWGGFGGRSGAMGGAFIGLADDWTANYWNPAGLAQLEGKGVGIDFLSPHPTLRGNNSFANLPPTPETESIYKYTHDMFINYSGVEPFQFDKTSTNYHFYHPNGLGCYVSYPDFTLGAAIYSPLAYYSDWNDTISYGMGTIEADNYQRLISVSSQLTIAREILPNLYAGAGAALLYDRIDRESEKVVANSGILDYTYDFDLEDDGFGAEGLFGLLYKFSEQLSIGAVYRTGSTVELKGRASSSLIGVSPIPIEESTRVTQKFRHPPTWGIGIAAKPIPKVLTFTADWQRTDWSFYRTNVKFDQDGMLLNSESYDEDWKDSNRYRFGCEYILNPAWALRAGFMYDESPMPAKSVSLAHIPDVDRKAISLGAGFKPGDDWQIDVLFASAWGNRNARGAKFEQRIWAIGLGATYFF